MGRAKKTDQPGAGHNSGELTDQDLADLTLWFERKIRAQEKKAAVAKAAYDEERGQINDLFAQLKSELRIARKDFEAMMADADLSQAEFIAKEAKRTKLYVSRGLPVGTQLALDLSGDTVTDQQMAEADGRRAFGRADDRIPPDHVSPVMHPDWLRGYDEEMTVVAERMGRAEKIVEARAAPAAEPEDEPEDEVEEEPDLSPSAVDAKARKLKREGFLKAGTSGGEPEQAAA